MPNRRAQAMSAGKSQARNPNGTRVRLLWIAVIFLAVIGLVAALRRTIVLLKPGALGSPRNPAAQLDAHFASERGLRSHYPQVHRWSGRIFLAASAVVGVTGLRLAYEKTIGGIDEKAAVALFGTFFLISLGKALWHALRREFAKHRECMIRGYAIGLAVATIRPIIGSFFAAAVLRGHAPDPHEFFGTAFWIGFTLQTIAAEIWINYTRPHQPVEFQSSSIAPAQG